MDEWMKPVRMPWLLELPQCGCCLPCSIYLGYQLLCDSSLHFPGSFGHWKWGIWLSLVLNLLQLHGPVYLFQPPAFAKCPVLKFQDHLELCCWYPRWLCNNCTGHDFIACRESGMHHLPVCPWETQHHHTIPHPLPFRVLYIPIWLQWYYFRPVAMA